MKKLKFAEHLVGLILKRQKYTTWRVDDEKDLSVGDTISCCRIDGKEFAKARITSVRETTFENLTKEDKESHEKFSSDEEMYKTYSRYYGINVTPKTGVKVIKFQLFK